MAAKNRKKTSHTSGPVSPKAYIQSGQARKLPLHECYVTEQWQESGMVQVIVSRRHVTGNITAGLYLVDLLCTGVKDSIFLFNEPEESLKEMMEKFNSDYNTSFEPCDYTLAHNIIFAALEFAAEYGIEPGIDFALTKMILEDDDEKIELIEIECGEDGMPVLIDNGLDARTGYYLRQLQKYAGEGNYKYVTEDEADYDENEEDEDDEEEEEDFYGEPEQWTKENWEDFIIDGDTDIIDRYENIPVYIYRKAIMEPEAAARGINIDEWMDECERSITYEPIPQPDYGKDPEEVKENEAIFYTIHKEVVTQKELKDLTVRIMEGIKKWPRSPVFYNHLFNTYLLLNDTKKANAVQQEQFDKFPNYLFAKITYANSLYQQDKADKIPAVFNNQLTLSSLYPERKQFHISEFTSFTATQCLYHIAIKDDLMAGMYGIMILEHATGPLYIANEAAIKGFKNYMMVKVLHLMVEALKDDEKRRGLVDLLVD